MDDVGVFLFYRWVFTSPTMKMMGSFMDVNTGVKHLKYKIFPGLISLLELVQDQNFDQDMVV